jgi:hypothetical protein
MRISSSKVQKEGNKSSESITLEASRDVSESFIEEESDAINAVKGNVDDSYILLISKSESEQKMKVVTNFPYIRYFITNQILRYNLRVVFNSWCKW